MYLKKIELNGFKSFASKTTLDFSLAQSENGEKKPHHGITIIVGPNGSGKSNIADAIRWVMGEQSMKNLRSKKSEDIIFVGSGKKARLGSAQVKIYLDNADKRFPLDFREVTIARKIFRSGESEYLVNDSRVRLQDVVDLLAQAGIGKESYSIVNQGMADAILNASPIERRGYIEDAAGVKHFQIKKDRAIRKLSTTRDNLSRAKELSEEIAPHLRMLKRQAKKAERGKEIAKKLKENQVLLYSQLFQDFREEKEGLELEKKDIGIEMMNLQREVDKLNDQISKESREQEENEKLAILEKEKKQKQEKLNELEKKLVITGGKIEIEREKEKNWENLEELANQSIAVDSGYIKKEIDSIKADQEKLAQKIARVENLSELQDLKELARAIAQRLFELRGDIEKGKKEKPAKNQEKNPQQKEIFENIKKLSARLGEIRVQIQNSEAEIEKTEKLIAKEIQLEKDKRKNFFELERKLRSKQEKLGKVKDEFNEAKINLAKIEVREEDLDQSIREDLGISKEKFEIKKTQGKIDLEELKSKVSRLKVQMEQVGGIDPLVVEEYQETQERYDFLEKESEDLKKAIASLKEVIKEMDQKIEKSFHETFSSINQEFSKYFKIIFGGGQAKLTKIKIESRRSKPLAEEDEEGKEDGEEKLEEKKQELGIDIFASPPGKRITNLSMLSGGERSLTSIALLFAIISHNPPPFSILDEVEAALDEANSRRFGKILQELSRDTQFVIISHNRETMRQASLLYGVTMGEDGISKLLSVKLDQIGKKGEIKK